MCRLSVGFFVLVLSFFVSFSAFARSMQSALDDAADHFARERLKIPPGKALVIEVVNIHNQKKDSTAKSIETQLYFSLEKRFPTSKLILGSEALAGVSTREAVFVKGTYQQEGKLTTLRLQAVKDSFTGEVMTQVKVVFDTQEVLKRSLVAVLGVEAESFNKVQIRIFSDVFRSALIEKKVFEVASSADVDKMDPDEIQKATGCTRDQCATIIGKQLGVDRSISSSISKFSEGVYFLEAKIFDIKNGSIVASKNLTYEGKIKGLPAALEELANKLTMDLQQSVVENYEIKQPIENITGSIDIESDPRSVKIFLNANYIGMTPRNLGGLKKGKYRITLKKEGYNDLGKTVFVTQNRETKLKVKLEKKYDAVFIDEKTGLMWDTRETSEMNWERGIQYCNRLKHAEFSDWRLPNKEELETMFAHTAYGNYTKGELQIIFPNINSSDYWSATISASNTAWYVYFDDGYMSSFLKSNSSYVRCVRAEYALLDF